MLGKEVTLVSDKADSRSKDDDCDCLSSQMFHGKTQDINESSNERELAV